jgi:uncharacterized protein
MKIKGLFLIGTLFFLAGAHVLFADNIPEPSGWVNDFAHVLSLEQNDKLTRVVREVEEKTSSEIAVAIVGSIAPHDEKEYARLLFDHWHVGKKGKDNGVLVLLSIKERLWRIETGYGVEGILPDGLCGAIGRNFMVPYFKQGHYGEGLYQGVARIASVIAENEHVNLETLSGLGAAGVKNASPSQDSISPFFVLFVVIFIVFSILSNLSNSRYAGRGGRYYGGGFGGGSFGGGGFGGFGGGGGGGGGAGGGF